VSTALSRFAEDEVAAAGESGQPGRLDELCSDAALAQRRREARSMGSSVPRPPNTPFGDRGSTLSALIGLATAPT
jgi:hypothetical protein